MADPLSLLRQFYRQKKLTSVVKTEDLITFGDLAYPKAVKTNYIKYGTGREGAPKEYYTLECLLFLLENEKLTHAVYVRNAAQKDIPAVSRPDRRDLLAYLAGEIESSENVDKSAPLGMPIQVKRPAESDRETVKRQRHNDPEQLERDKERMRKILDDTSKPNLLNAEQIRGLSEELTADKIAEIKKKRSALKRTMIKPLDDELQSSQFGDSEMQTDITSITSKERVWKTRSTALEASSKKFAESIFKMLQMLKTKEEATRKTTEVSSSRGHESSSSAPAKSNRPSHPETYSRYDQERFSKKDEESEFQIDPTQTYRGTTLKSITEGAKAKPQQVSGGPAATSSNQENSKPQKRTSKTPIIVLPAGVQSTVNMFNVRELLQDLKYVNPEEKKASGARREAEVLVQRTKEGGLTVPYRVVDNPMKLTEDEWDRVVAVFVQGPAWQFKGWPWNGNPVDIFSKAAFHIKWEEMPMDPNVAKWKVEILTLSKTKRHKDRESMLRFWSILDHHIMKHKPNLRY